MKYLKNFDEGSHFLDLESGEISVQNPEVDSIGWYKIIDEKVSAIYVKNGLVFLMYEEEVIPLNLEKKSRISTVDEKTKLFELIDKGKILISFLYEVENDLVGLPPFDFIDEEDFDWGLFLVNITNDPKRKTTFVDIHSQ